MPRPTPESVRMRPSIVWLALGLLLADVASAQTTAALGTSIVFPVAAQTVSFASEVTLFNPGPTLLTAAVHFYEANNSVAPGTKACNDVSVPAGRSVQIMLATQCALGVSGGHFGSWSSLTRPSRRRTHSTVTCACRMRKVSASRSKVSGRQLQQPDR